MDRLRKVIGGKLKYTQEIVNNICEYTVEHEIVIDWTHEAKIHV